MTNIKVALDASIINEKAGSLSLYITPDSSSIEVIRRLLTKWSLTSKTPEEFQLWMISDTNAQPLENVMLFYDLAAFSNQKQPLQLQLRHSKPISQVELINVTRQLPELPEQHVRFDIPASTTESHRETWAPLDENKLALLAEIQQETALLLEQQKKKEINEFVDSSHLAKQSYNSTVSTSFTSEKEESSFEEVLIEKEEIISQLKAAVSKLKGQLDKTEALKRSIVKSYTITLSRVDFELQSHRVHVVELEELLDHAIVSSSIRNETTSTNFYEKKNSQEEVIALLQATVDRERQSKASFEAAMKSQLTKCQATAEHATRKLVQSDKIIDNLRFKLKQAEENEKLKSRLAALESRGLQNQAIEDELLKIRKEFNCLTVKLTQAEEREVALKKELTTTRLEAKHAKSSKEAEMEKNLSNLESKHLDELNQLKIQFNAMKTKYSDESKNLIKKLSEAQAELKSKTNQLSLIEEHVESQGQQMEEAHLSFKKEKEATENLVLKMKKQISDISIEKEGMKEQLNNEKLVIKKMGQKEAKIKEEMNDAQQKVFRLQRKLSKKHEVSKSTTEKNLSEVKLESSIIYQIIALEFLIDSLNELRETKLTEAQQQISLLNNEVERMKLADISIQDKVVELEVANQQLQHTVKKYEVENETLCKEQEKNKASLAEEHLLYQTQIQSQNEQLADAQKENDKLTVKIINLQTQVQKLSTQLEDEKKHNEQRLTEAKPNADLTTTMGGDETFQTNKEIDILKEEIAKLTTIRDDISSQLMSSKEALVKVANEKISIQSKLDAAEKVNQELSNKMQCLEKTTQEREEETEKLLRKLNEKELSTQELQMQLQSSKSNHLKSNAEYESKISSLKEEHNVLLNEEKRLNKELQQSLDQVQEELEIQVKTSTVEQSTTKQMLLQLQLNIKMVKDSLHQHGEEIQSLLKEHSQNQVAKIKENVLTQVGTIQDQFSTEKEEMNIAVCDLKKTNEMLAQKLAACESKCNSLLLENKTLREKVDIASLEIQSSKKEFVHQETTLQNEISALKNKIEELASTLSQSRKENEVSINEVINEKEVLENNIISLKKDLEIKNEQIRSLEESHDATIKEITEELDKERSAAEQVVNDCEEKMKTSSESFRKEVEKLNVQLQNTLAEREALRLDFDMVKEKNESLLKEEMELYSKIRLREAEIDNLNQDLKNTEENVKKIQAETYSKLVAMQETHSSEILTLQETMKELANEKMVIERDKEAVEHQVSLEKQIHKQHIVQLQTEIKLVRDKFSELAYETQTLLNNYEAQMKEFTEVTINKAATEKKDANSKAYTSKLTIERLQQMLHESESKCNSLVLENTTLSEKVDAASLQLQNCKAEFANQEVSLQSEINALKGKAKELESAVNTLRKTNEVSMNEAMKQKEGLESSISALNKDLEIRNEQLKVMEEQNRSLKKDNDAMIKQLTEELDKERITNKQVVQDWEVKMKESSELFRKEVEMLNSQLQNALNEKEAAFVDLNNVKQENEDLLKKAEELERKIKLKETEIDNIDVKLKDLQQNFTRVQTEANDKMTHLKEDHSNEILILREKIQQLANEKASIISDNDTLKVQFAKEKQDKEKEIKSCSKELERHREQYGKLLAIVMDKQPSLLEMISSK